MLVAAALWSPVRASSRRPRPRASRPGLARAGERGRGSPGSRARRCGVHAGGELCTLPGGSMESRPAPSGPGRGERRACPAWTLGARPPMPPLPGEVAPRASLAPAPRFPWRGCVYQPGVSGVASATQAAGRGHGAHLPGPSHGAAAQSVGPSQAGLAGEVRPLSAVHAAAQPHLGDGLRYGFCAPRQVAQA